jgi:hypothetical protein
MYQPVFQLVFAMLLLYPQHSEVIDFTGGHCEGPRRMIRCKNNKKYSSAENYLDCSVSFIMSVNIEPRNFEMYSELRQRSLYRDCLLVG